MRFFKIVAVVVVLLMGSQVETEARGQVIKGLWKAGKELVKGASKQSSKSTRNVTKVKPAKSTESTGSQNRAKDVPIFINCNRCKGSGKISYWNPQKQQLQRVDCSKCNGRGKVLK